MGNKKIKHQGITKDRSVHRFLQKNFQAVKIAKRPESIARLILTFPSRVISMFTMTFAPHCIFTHSVSFQSKFPLSAIFISILATAFKNPLLSLKIMTIFDKSGIDYYLKWVKPHHVNSGFSLLKVKFYDFLSHYQIFGHLTVTNIISWM